jgi:hypothetical protein
MSNESPKKCALCKASEGTGIYFLSEGLFFCRSCVDSAPKKLLELRKEYQQLKDDRVRLCPVDCNHKQGDKCEQFKCELYICGGYKPTWRSPDHIKPRPDERDDIGEEELELRRISDRIAISKPGHHFGTHVVDKTEQPVLNTHGRTGWPKCYGNYKKLSDLCPCNCDQDLIKDCIEETEKFDTWKAKEKK